MINCLIFDCDGTLVDSEYLASLGLEIKLREIGIESKACELMQRFQGVKLGLIVEQIEFDNKIKFNDQFIPSFRAIVDRLFEQHLQPCEGVVEMLESIQVPVCVASSGPPEKIHKALSLTGLLGYFYDNRFSCYSINSWKPAPDIFIHAANQMGFSAKECAVVEDSQVGLKAAILSGAMPIHYDPKRSQDAVAGTHKIEHMSQLKHLLESIR